MPINPNIALGVQPIQTPDLMGSMGQAMTLRSLMDQQKLRDMQVMGLQRQYAQEDALKSAGVMGPDGNLDEAATLRNLSGVVGPVKAQEWKNKFTQDRLGVQKAEAEKRKADLDDLEKRWAISAQSFFPILDAHQRGQPALPLIQKAVQQLAANGINFRPEDLPQSEDDVPAFLQMQISHGATIAQQMQEARERRKQEDERNRPLSEPGRIAFDIQNRGRWSNNAPTVPPPVGGEVRPFNPAPVNAQPIDAQGQPVGAPAFDPMMEGYWKSVRGNAPDGFRWGPDGNPVPMREVQDFLIKKGKASASNVRVGVTAFDKELDELSAKTISTARDTAEKAYTTADDMGMIVEALKGWGGGPFKEFAALIGKALPGTEFEKISTASQFAESIRQRLAPTMRVVGSGSTSDMEMRGFLASIPSLSNTETGRLLIARVARKIADRAAAAADIKEEMIRAKTYTVRAFRERMKSEFGDSILDDEDKKMLKLNQPNYNISGMPDPKSSAGKTIEAEDGTRYRSDGNRWVRQ